MISGVLAVGLVFCALMLGGFTGAWAIWPTAYRHGYAEGEQDRHRHRAGARQETTLLELPRAGRLPLLPDEPCDHEYTPNEAGTHEWCQKCDSVRPVRTWELWVFAGGWDQGPVAEPAEHDLLTQTAEQPVETSIAWMGDLEAPVAGVDTPSDFIEGMTETVNAMISEWVAQGNVDRHTMHADG